MGVLVLKFFSIGKSKESKFSEIDIEGMSDDEFSKISPELYRVIVFKGVIGLLLFIVCFILLVVGGRYVK